MLGLGPRSGAPGRALRPWQDMAKRLCQRGSSAGLGGGRRKRRGLAAPGAEGGCCNPHPAAAVQADPTSTPKLVGSSPQEITRDYPAPCLEGGRCGAGAASRHGAGPGQGTPSCARSAVSQGQSLFRDQLVPSRATPTD